MKEIWQKQLSNIINNNNYIKIFHTQKNIKLFLIKENYKYFSVKIPHNFIKNIKYNDLNDPILLQFIPCQEETIIYNNYTKNPLNETYQIPGMLHKYENRLLILLTGICAIHCRYCFRKNTKNNFYLKNENWNKILLYIKKNIHINEIIFSGGDPLMIQDNKLNNFIKDIVKITHIKILRIHTRMISILPSRITTNLLKILQMHTIKIVIVTHINHANEITLELYKKIILLKNIGITILNQSVLLKNINDHPNILIKLSNKLFNIGIIPYYLHILDKVHGSKHFFVSEKKALNIIKSIKTKLSGFLIPKVVKEIKYQNKKYIC
ncbi:KamA family radical SAM protein [Enterobacteriaceae endosymbiont of Neohaemonia nigricornis]|uniref:KamA family radical SAM protein n=1 Tax=Enterobacteriaceae endosymbiont of Neohaemonia nigricornis TaxID=2675792 RepID=UPI001B3ADDD6|nr:KamA family radical SAM protein [Enterobacteriaceae endosymbiont of Neohaemonia nigricornis]